jgi:hypothetical protein
MKKRHLIIGITFNFFLSLGYAQTLDQKQGKCLGATMLVQGVGGEITPQLKKIQSDFSMRFSPLYQKVNSCTNGSSNTSLVKSCATKLLVKSDADFFIETLLHMDKFDTYVTKEKSSIHLVSNCGEFFRPK